MITDSTVSGKILTYLTSLFWGISTDLVEWIGLIASVISILMLLILAGKKIFRRWKNSRKKSYLKKRLKEDWYSSTAIEKATDYYIEPYCQNIDPVPDNKSEASPATNHKIFYFVDKLLNNPTQYHHIMLLADSGMGKTAFMLNYYGRHLQQPKKKFELKLLPMGIANIDEHIGKIPNPSNTILFLDAFDEDIQAMVNHRQRLKTVLKFTQGFKKIIISCHTQFFAKDATISDETGLSKMTPRKKEKKAEDTFHKIYLSPFSNDQLTEYLHRRYSFWRASLRKKTWEVINKSPSLMVRPILLTYIEYLINLKKEIHYAFELYEVMINAWLTGEEAILGIKKKHLREFCEALAVDIYLKREQRGAEKIPQKEIKMMADAWKIAIDHWKLSGPSLLNRNSLGNYSFAHRSIMEYLFVKRVLNSSQRFSTNSKIHWSDQMKTFIQEMLHAYQTSGEKIPFNLSLIDTTILHHWLRFRPIEQLKEKDVQKMLQLYNFYDNDKHPTGQGVCHHYQVIERSGEDVIIDRATNLMWQRAGSLNDMEYKEARKYIKNLNRKKLAGYSDWRLPTLEEAMSLVEPQKKKHDLYLDPLFDKTQQWIWTTDRYSSSSFWLVCFSLGGCDHRIAIFNSGSVRAVRLGQ